MVTVPDKCQTHYMQGLTSALSGRRDFSPKYLVQAYNQIPADAANIPKTKVTTLFQLLDFLRVLFRPTNFMSKAT